MFNRLRWRQVIRFLACLAIAAGIVFAWKIWKYARRDYIGYAYGVINGAPILPRSKQGFVFRMRSEMCTQDPANYGAAAALMQSGANSAEIEFHRRSGAILRVGEGTPVLVVEDDGDMAQIQDGDGMKCWLPVDRIFNR